MRARKLTLTTASVFLVALCLRPSITSLGPLLPEVGAAFDLSESAQGLLGSIPLIAFGAVSPVVARMSRRWGSERTILAALLVLALATAVRSWTGSWGLWVGTLLIGGAIAVGNVLVPVVVRRDFPGNVETATGVYSACITGGAAIASAAAVPIAHRYGWQVALGVWAILALVVALAWAPRAVRSPAPVAEPDAVAASPIWRQSTAWWVTAFLGLQSTCFYVLVTWLPTIEIDGGLTPSVAGWHLFLFQALGLVGGLAIPALLRRGGDQRLGVAVASAPIPVALVGFLVWPNAALWWVVLAGLGQGAALVSALTLVSVRGRTHAEAARLSGMAQSLGYLFAAIGPVLAGALVEATGGWRLPLLVLTGVGVLQVLVGLRAGREHPIGTER